jgi:hypothetical protein
MRNSSPRLGAAAVSERNFLGTGFGDRFEVFGEAQGSSRKGKW